MYPKEGSSERCRHTKRVSENPLIASPSQHHHNIASNKQQKGILSLLEFEVDGDTIFVLLLWHFGILNYSSGVFVLTSCCVHFDPLAVFTFVSDNSIVSL
jgi:hypothetical protein